MCWNKVSHSGHRILHTELYMYLTLNCKAFNIHCKAINIHCRWLGHIDNKICIKHLRCYLQECRCFYCLINCIYITKNNIHKLTHFSLIQKIARKRKSHKRMLIQAMWQKVLRINQSIWKLSVPWPHSCNELVTSVFLKWNNFNINLTYGFLRET